MRSSPRFVRLFLLALLALPGPAGAAPITVTYEVTGGNFYDDNVDLVSGTIVVTFPNPGSGLPPISTAAHSIYFNFLNEYGLDDRGRATPVRFPVGMAFRGVNQTLSALRQVTRFRDCHGRPPSPTNCEHRAFDRHRIRADRYGNITYGFFGHEPSAEGTFSAWISITGHEVASTAEPAPGFLLALGGVLASAAAAARRRWRS